MEYKFISFFTFLFYVAFKFIYFCYSSNNIFWPARLSLTGVLYERHNLKFYFGFTEWKLDHLTLSLCYSEFNVMCEGVFHSLFREQVSQQRWSLIMFVFFLQNISFLLFSMTYFILSEGWTIWIQLTSLLCGGLC